MGTKTQNIPTHATLEGNAVLGFDTLQVSILLEE